jgi:hypothetical protein
MLALLRRAIGRIVVLFAVLELLLIAFQIALVAIATSLTEGGGVERLAALAPAFVQQLIGAALASFSGLASIGFFEPLIVMLIVQFAIYVAVEPAGDVEAGLVDLILARPRPRRDLITRSLIVTTGVAVALPFTMAASLWISLWTMAPMTVRWPEPRTVVLLASHLGALAWCLGMMALAVSGWARRRGGAQAAVGVGAVVFYLMEFVGESWSRVSWMTRLTPFHLFHGSSLLVGRTQPAHDLAILLSIGIAAMAVAYWRFDRRDL